MLAGGGMGKRAVRGLWFGAVLARGSMAGTACCMTAGVSGSMVTPSLVTAGVMRSWAVSDFVTGVSRLARRSMTTSLTTEYGKGLRRMLRRCEYHCSSRMSEMSVSPGEDVVNVGHI
jgi:hypothetical protein